MRAVGERLRPNSGGNRRWALHAKPFLDPASGKGGVLKDFISALAWQLATTVVESDPFKELLHHWTDPLLFFLFH
jgi:hypothetical protein